MCDMRCRWLVCFLQTLAEVRSRFKEFTCPFFVLQGTGDRVCDPAGAQMIYDDAASVKKQIKVRTSTRDTRDQFYDGRIS